MKRRVFLKNLIAGAAALAASAIPYGLLPFLAPRRAAAERNYLRPPGALKDDAAFVAACIGCGLCGEVCPPRCIRFHARDGGGKVNTPYIDAAEKACILCDKCMEVCPTEDRSHGLLSLGRPWRVRRLRQHLSPGREGHRLRDVESVPALHQGGLRRLRALRRGVPPSEQANLDRRPYAGNDRATQGMSHAEEPD
jgi:ferredoxin